MPIFIPDMTEKERKLAMLAEAASFAGWAEDSTQELLELERQQKSGEAEVRCEDFARTLELQAVALKRFAGIALMAAVLGVDATTKPDSESTP